MAGYLVQLQRQMGRAMRQIHKAGGFTVSYTHATDTSVSPMTETALTLVPMQPTPIATARSLSGGRWREVMESGGQLSPEAQPFFVVSREALKTTTGTLLTPTLMDEFVETGTTTPVFRVEKRIEIGAPPWGWLLLVKSVLRAAGGTG